MQVNGHCLGDLVKMDEDLDSAPYRVLRQRTGLDDVFLQQVGSFGAINRHPSGRVITTAYYSLINIRNHKLKITDNEVHWHSLKNLKESCLSIIKKLLKLVLQRLADTDNG